MKRATLNRFSMQTKQPCAGRRCHPGLSQLDGRSQCLGSKLQGQADSPVRGSCGCAWEAGPVFIDHRPSPGSRKDDAELLCPVCERTQSLVTAIGVHHGLLNFSPLWSPLLRKQDSLQILLPQCTWSPRTLVGMDETDVSMPTSTTSALQPADQEVIVTFKSCYFTNTFREVLAATGMIPWPDPGKGNRKPLGRIHHSRCQ